VKCCDIMPGMLRHSVQLQALTNTPDGAGGFTTTWTTYATVRASLENISGTERIFNDRLNAETTVKATIRYNSEVKESDRLVFDGREYQIRYIDNIEFRNRWLKLTLEGGVAT